MTNRGVWNATGDLQNLRIGDVRAGDGDGERAAVSLDQEGRFTPGLAWSVGLGPTRSPQTGLAH